MIIGALGAFFSVYGDYSFKTFIMHATFKDQVFNLAPQAGFALLRFIFGVFLIVKVDFFASRMITEGEVGVPGIDNRDLRIFVYRFVGLSFMVSAVIGVISDLISYFKSPNIIPFLLFLAPPIVELLIGALLFFGLRSTIDFIKKFRTVGFEDN